MQYNNLSSLGWRHFFQSQLDLQQLETTLPVRVISVQRDQLSVAGIQAENQALSLSIASYFWRDEPPECRPTVGDWLLLDEEFRPVRLLERQTVLKRKATGKDSAMQLIAANVDTVFIVSSCNDDFSLNRIERYLAIARQANIHCVVVLTKADLCDDPDNFRDQVNQSHPDIAAETLNGTDPMALKTLEKWIGNGQTVAMVGSSGVGKSTLINGLLGQPVQATSAVRGSDQKGRHTTTARSLHLLPQGGLVLDLPGMRELQLIDAQEGVGETFTAIQQRAQDCRFQDCQHRTEPGCAVLAAIKAGQLDARLLENFHKLDEQQQRHSRSYSERRRDDRALGKFYKQAKKSARHFKSRE